MTWLDPLGSGSISREDLAIPDFVRRGKVLVVQRQFHGAVKVCRLGLLGNPSCVEGRLVLGMALIALGRHEEVLAEMRVALELDADNPMAHFLRGEALVGKSDLSGAYDALLRAHDLDPLNDKVRNLLFDVENLLDPEEEDADRPSTSTRVYPAPAARHLSREGVGDLSGLTGVSEVSLVSRMESGAGAYHDEGDGEDLDEDLRGSEEGGAEVLENDDEVSSRRASMAYGARDLDDVSTAETAEMGDLRAGDEKEDEDLDYDEDEHFTTAPWLAPHRPRHKVGSADEDAGDTEVEEPRVHGLGSRGLRPSVTEKEAGLLGDDLVTRESSIDLVDEASPPWRENTQEDGAGGFDSLEVDDPTEGQETEVNQVAPSRGMLFGEAEDDEATWALEEASSEWPSPVSDRSREATKDLAHGEGIDAGEDRGGGREDGDLWEGEEEEVWEGEDPRSPDDATAAVTLPESRSLFSMSEAVAALSSGDVATGGAMPLPGGDGPILSGDSVVEALPRIPPDPGEDLSSNDRISTHTEILTEEELASDRDASEDDARGVASPSGTQVIDEGEVADE
ncbi:MAG: hypothetical protein KAI47_18835, partial [Deltaproteobacteria bacterium]|nr:hypothetical protein [Deltaproteobacteria bacterium]